MAGAILALCGAQIAGATTAPLAPDLDAFSIEELGQIQITSVSKRPEAIGQAASAAYVITNEDIERSGALTLPEALRLAPNLEVMRIDALDYSISARGFSGFEAANKLLVMIDGRSVYTPLYSGVDWDQHHLLFDDVDRIEVVSGPGGALWGANAVNGVINVSTRPAQDTLGALASLTGGTLDSDLRLRYGAKLGRKAAFRVYATAYKRGEMEKPSGVGANDDWDGVQGGFRGDWQGGADNVTLQGDYAKNRLDESLGLAGYVRGGNVLGRWDHSFSDRGQFQVQAYYDKIEREARLVHDSVETADIQIQHAVQFGDRHQVVLGGGYRHISDDFHTLFGVKLLDPEQRKSSISNVFAQDEIALRRDVALTIGLKVENNSYTGAEAMPNLRLAWRPDERHTLWAAVSRSVRNPSRVERDFSIPGVVTGGYFDAEDLIAYEAGYRGQPVANGSVSVSVYYNDYDRLRTNEAASATTPAFVGNTMEGRVIGAEVWGDYALTPWWRIRVGASVLDKHFKLKAGSRDTALLEAGGADPDGWVNLRSQMRLGEHLNLDVNLRGYGAIPKLAAGGYVGAPAYAEAQARLAWKITPGVELSVTGANLLHERHAEASETRRLEIPRNFAVGLRWVR
jgi:iron complex outermembrane receptor protein